ncbi:hypothetical protein N7462_006933 [Penicillium macrosclerotiorum]|uniref:uncharacterized protein n=1 Tax=Penicillium macrosclerotiorum TaxID=303699 RepID=UPI002547DE2E|nr:uncharacterized protein N7462_006933 [Penicillium macrosclerotiorum]KAJ5678689.1 hypothetical protein N7462_006933 [Penicillium macrosclerotiorum]
MALFSKRLTCFYCGRRATKPVRGPVHKFHCEHCEADNYLDQHGDITDPPASDTNPEGLGPDVSSPPFESTEFRRSDLFCSQCVRNQHLLATTLASYFPPPDDPEYADYERDYPQFRKRAEDRYPQVCSKCEDGVLKEIRKKGYEAKADHLRRMMDQTRASRAARMARRYSWQSLLVYAGSIGYWSSVAGQLSWDVMSALTSPHSLEHLGFSDAYNAPSVSLLSCITRTRQLQRIPGECSVDLAPLAGLSLVAGSLSIWWNPKLRMKVEGLNGRFAGLGEYYQVQLIVLVVRCVFWALLKDPSTSGMVPTMPPALHMFMIMFTVLSVVVSRRVVQYDTRPLVNWSDNSWERPLRSTETSPAPASPRGPANTTPTLGNGSIDQPFPIHKLGEALPSLGKGKSPAAIPPTPPSEVEDMDWTPSAPQNIQPTVSVYQRNRPSAFDGPSPFTGKIPAAPKPPAWNLRARNSTKPIEQVVTPNPFHRSPSHPPNQWQMKNASPEPVFKPPRFFPTSDLDNSTGLEALFDRTFNIASSDEPRRDWNQSTSNLVSYSESSGYLVFQYLRLILLVGSMAAWTFSQNHQLSIPGNFIEACALGSASLIAGFALLEAVKRPLAYWNGKEILVSITQLGAAVHLGAHIPQPSYDREYFDRYGKMLLVFMAVQEALGLLALYRTPAPASSPEIQQPMSPLSPQPGSPQQLPSNNAAISWPSRKSPVNNTQSFNMQASPPPLSFTSTAGGTSFSSALSSSLPPAPHYQISSSNSFNHFPTPRNKNPHSFTMSELKENEPPSDYDQDSDTETIATTATNRTDATTHNIRYGRYSNLDFNPAFSPRRNELGPGIGGLSLEDRPVSKRVTRSQTQQGLTGRRVPGRLIR